MAGCLGTYRLICADSKKITLGQSVVMGRHTYESIGRPLPQRQNIVVTSHPERIPAGLLAVAGLEEAIASTAHDELFVIGGARLYRQALDLADRLLVTRVLADVEGDTHFSWDWIPATVWELIEEECPPPTDQDDLPFCYQVYGRRPA